MDETPKGFNAHVDYSRGSEKFTAILPHEFPKNAQGVMRKPHIKNYLTYDLYIAPSALEGADQSDPGIFQMSSGESHWFDKYRISFDKFAFDEHGDKTPESVSVVLNIEYGTNKEKVVPSLDLTSEEVVASEVKFDNGHSSIQIVGVNPENGSVALKIRSDFIPLFEPKVATLIIELSKKPLIILFWIGSLTVFLAGAIAMIDRKRQTGKTQAEDRPVFVGKTEEAAA
jgi:cytochrome c biogenesis factor